MSIVNAVGWVCPDCRAASNSKLTTLVVYCMLFHARFFSRLFVGCVFICSVPSRSMQLTGDQPQN